MYRMQPITASQIGISRMSGGDLRSAGSADAQGTPKGLTDLLEKFAKAQVAQANQQLDGFAREVAKVAKKPVGSYEVDELVEQAVQLYPEYAEAQEQVRIWTADLAKATTNAARREAKDEIKTWEAEIAQLQPFFDGIDTPMAQSLLQGAVEAYERSFTTNTKLGGKNALKTALKWEGHPENKDAASATAVATNATIWTARFGYGTHEARQAWLTDLPKDQKLKLAVVCTPSAHVGDAEYEQYARTNRYEVTVEARTVNGSIKTIKTSKFGVQKPPEYATASAVMELDLTPYAGGALRVLGWPEGSGGAGGYNEDRETIIHIP